MNSDCGSGVTRSPEVLRRAARACASTGTGSLGVVVAGLMSTRERLRGVTATTPPPSLSDAAPSAIFSSVLIRSGACATVTRDDVIAGALRAAAGCK